jgi:hypothetical protein
VTAAVRAALIRSSAFLVLGGVVVLVASLAALRFVREHIGWPAGASSYVVQDVGTGRLVAQEQLWIADVAAAVTPSLIAVGVAALIAGGALRAAAGRPVPVDPDPTARVVPSAGPGAAEADRDTSVGVASATARRTGSTSTHDRRELDDLDRYRPPSPRQ